MIRPLVLGAVAALGVGMSLVAAGVSIGPLFMPGVFIIGAGFLLAAAGGILALRGTEGDASA